MSFPAWAAETMRLRVDDYQIDAELIPHTHKITAQAKVKFTALEDLNIATFELHNALRVTKVVDASGKLLSAERVTQDSTVRVALATPVAKDTSSTLTFDYEGVLDSADDSPVQGLKLAYIGDDTSYLLYAGRWFPVNAYGINRFTATINITVPAHMTVIGSGKETPGIAPAVKRPAGSLPTKTFSFTWDKPSFPGTIVAGKTGTSTNCGPVRNCSVPPNAWFTAFAPAGSGQTPTIAVAVIVLDGGDLGSDATGGLVAAPIAKQVIQAYQAYLKG